MFTIPSIFDQAIVCSEKEAKHLSCSPNGQKIRLNNIYFVFCLYPQKKNGGKSFSAGRGRGDGANIGDDKGILEGDTPASHSDHL